MTGVGANVPAMAPPVVVAAGPTVSYEHPMQLDTVLDADLDGIADQAAQLAAAGFDGAFTFEGPRDVFLPLVPATSAGLQLYTNVAIALPRSPMHLAYTAWDLQRASHGRFALGVGSQIKPHIERRYSALWDKPVAQMRELIQALRAIFDCFQNGSPLDFRGDYYTHTLMIPTHNPGPLEWGPPPIWAAAPNSTSFGLESMVEKSVIAPIPRKISGGNRPYFTPK